MLAPDETRPFDVLLVEDNRGDALLVERALRDVAPLARLRVANDGVIALSYLRERSHGVAAATSKLPDVVLLDLDLPQRGGLDVLAEIRSESAFRGMPVVVLSSSRAPRDVARAEALQATAYINKPASDYHDVIRTVVGFVQSGMRFREKRPTPPLGLQNVPRPALTNAVLRALFQRAAHATLLLDAQGTIVDANDAVQRLFQREPASLIGRPIDTVLSDRSRGGVRDLIAAELLRGPASEGSAKELIGMAGGQRELAVELRVRTIVGEPSTLLLGTFEDISERKVVEERTRELGRSNAELEHFAHVISHDLQEPVRMVASYTRLLSEDYRDQLDENAQLYIHFASSGAQHMQSLIRDLLAYSRVGMRRRSLLPVSVTECLTLAVSSLQVAIDEHRAVVSSDPLPEVNGDRTQITELLQNLIGNAIKFRREVPPEIHLSAERIGSMWQFLVRDNGIGIPASYYDDVFQIFRRLHGRGDYPGTGIGLAICKRIVEQFGGRIWVESEPSKGSTFYFTLPAIDGLGVNTSDLSQGTAR